MPPPLLARSPGRAPAGYQNPSEAANSRVSAGGKIVLVKPNMTAQCRIEKAATTHLTLIKAMVKALERRGAKKIMVDDNPGATAFGINEKCARTTGILGAATAVVPPHNPSLLFGYHVLGEGHFGKTP